MAANHLSIAPLCLLCILVNLACADAFISAPVRKLAAPLNASAAAVNSFVPAPEQAPVVVAEQGFTPRNAFPDPVADPQYSTYAPFSGAIYVYNSDGTYTTTTPAQCPAEANLNCGPNLYQWCCPNGCTCHQVSDAVVGCCASGSQCTGTPTVTTVTVNHVVTQPTTIYQATTLVPAGCDSCGETTAAAAGGVYNGYCSTMVANGPGLPTTAAGDCGTILVVNDGGRLDARGGKLLGIGMAAAVVVMNGIVGGWWAWRTRGVAYRGL